MDLFALTIRVKRRRIERDMAESLAQNQARVTAALAKPRPVHKQPKIGHATYHWLWAMRQPEGRKNDFELSDVTLVELEKRVRCGKL